MKRIFYTIAVIFFANMAIAQDLPVYSQYLQNFYYLSPAAVGIQPCKELILTGREQWTGFKGAPSTQGIGVYSQFNMFDRNKNTSNGIGISFYNDKNGANTKRRFQFSFAQHLKLFQTRRRKTTYVSFALAASGFQYKFNEAGLVPENTNDPILTGGAESAILLNFDAAMMIYNKKFSAGITAAQLVPSKISFYSTPYTVKKHFFGFFSFKRVNRDGFGFEPLIVFKTTGTTHQIDLNTKIHLNNFMHSGISYRHNLDVGTGESLSAAIFFGLTQKNYAIHYSYDFATSRIGRYNLGSHNIALSLRICNKKDRACSAYGSW